MVRGEVYVLYCEGQAPKWGDIEVSPQLYEHTTQLHMGDAVSRIMNRHIKTKLPSIIKPLTTAPYLHTQQQHMATEAKQKKYAYAQ